MKNRKSNTTKRCSHCKEIKSVSKFSKNKNRKDGLTYWCKKCISERDKRYYQKHRTKCLELAKKYNQEHPVKYLENQRKYKNTIHGHLVKVWHQMLYRCNDPKNKAYKYYGGRGIEVRFACFKDFYAHVIEELKVDPRKLTIDRINNDGHYEYGNVRFVTQTENNNNRRKKYKKFLK